MRTPTLLAFLVLLPACDGLPGLWSASSHPCSGNRTDTLWFDSDDRTGWVGCGSTTSGYGLYQTTDGGRTWAAPTTDPAGYFNGFRVSSISRSADGLLYVAGTDSGVRVASVDTNRTPMVVTPVFEPQGVTWTTFHVGTFRRTAAGVSIAESLTGVDVAWRSSDSAEWQNGYGWWGSNAAVQILDMVEHDGKIYGAGSRISQPPYVFLPPESGVFPFDPVILDTGVMGEMWGLDADEGGIAVGGVNQSSSVGVIFTTSGDGRDSGEWTRTDVSNVIPDTDATWIRGVCRQGTRVIAVGEFSRRSDGLVLESTDGGASWSDITPSGPPSLHRCRILGDGTVAVAGADGYFARK